MRIDRKREHIEYFLKTENKGNTLFDCVFLEYDSLPELNLEDIFIKLTGKELLNQQEKWK